nr:efflux RND transporter periplasmic adaptor subunit [Psychromonas arctica]
MAADLAVAEEFQPVDCVINPYKVVDVSSAVSGVLDTVKVERSDWVKKGQVIATLESGIERASLALAKVRADIDSEINLSKVNLAFDEKYQARIGKLYERNVVSYKIKDEADREVELSNWEVQQAKDMKKVRKLELQRAKEQVKQKTIRAPFDGFVIQKFKAEGEYVEDLPIVRIAQFDPLLIEAIVPMELFGKIEIGMVGLVYPELYSDDPKQAQVVAVDRMGDAASRTFGVRLELPNPDFKIPAGLKCEMKFNAVDVASTN